MKILVLNGSPQGTKGNCQKFIKKHLKVDATDKIEVITLANKGASEKALKTILKTEAVVFISGTYWDSWGSPLQAFFEKLTALEGHPHLMGLPCSCIVLMHSVGGKSVLSRMQGILNTMGFLIPPMSGMVYSLVNKLASAKKSTHAPDFWAPEDWQFIYENLKIANSQKSKWKAWPFDNKDPRRVWI